MAGTLRIAGKPLKQPKFAPHKLAIWGISWPLTSFQCIITFLSWANRLVALMKLFSLRRTVSENWESLFCGPPFATKLYKSTEDWMIPLRGGNSDRYTVASADSRRMQSSCDCLTAPDRNGDSFIVVIILLFIDIIVYYWYHFKIALVQYQVISVIFFQTTTIECSY